MEQNYFVGRSKELQMAIEFLFGDSYRESILNIHGTGGIGKSYLLDEINRRTEMKGIPFILLDSQDFNHTPTDLSNTLLAAQPQNFRKMFFCQSNDRQDIEEILGAFDQKILQFLEPREFIKFGRETIRIVKNMSNDIVGLFVTIPIHQCSIPYLKTLPVTKHYFQTLTGAELEEHNAPVHQPAGWFIFHAETRKNAGQGVKSEILRLINTLYTKGSMILFTTPLELNWRIALRLGYEEIKGATLFVFGERFPSQMFRLDLRGQKLLPYFDALIQNAFPSNPGLPDNVFGFSKREREVAAYVVKGISNKEIADKLFISEVAIKKHVSRILGKAGVKTRGQLIKLLWDQSI